LLKQAAAAEEEDSGYGRDRHGDERPKSYSGGKRGSHGFRKRGKHWKNVPREQAESQGKDPKKAEPEPKA
jgi:hypothetical protein